jgi:quercetin dioxygenase-like cupin family protein
MVIKALGDVPFEDMSGYNNVTKQICIGPKDGSNEVVVRYFSVAPGGNTPYHDHGFPHLVKVEKGQGAAIDSEGKEHALSAGQFVYVADDEVHGFRNTGGEAFEFICIVPERGEA